MFVALDALPHAQREDRPEGPAPPGRGDRQRNGARHDSVGPRNPAERLLADICAEVLKVRDFGIHDSLFDLGADSIQVFQITARANDAGLNVTPKQVLSERTIAAICKGLERVGRATARAEGPQLVAVSRDRYRMQRLTAGAHGRDERTRIGPMIAPKTLDTAGQNGHATKPVPDEVFVFPATVGQTGFWYLDQLQPGNPAYNIAVRFRLQGPLRVEELERALNEIVKRHESLRTVFAAVEGVPVQVVSPRLSIRLKRDDLRAFPEKDRPEHARAVAVEEGRRRFDLAKGPLIRARLLRLDDEEHTLLVTIHHIVSDGWAIGVLTRGAWAPCTTPTVAASTRRFPSWPSSTAITPSGRSRASRARTLNDEVGFWTRQLARLPLLEVPTDRPRPPVQAGDGDIESILLPRALTDGLDSLSHREKATPFMLMLAAFQLLLQRRSGRSDVFVGTVSAGRSRVELEPLIGLFINPLVFRTDLSGDPPFLELLTRVRETVLQAFAHQDVPFERVVDAVQPKRDPSRHPVFQINFLYQRDFVQPFHASGLTLTAIPSVSPGAIYDLNFFLVERVEGWRASCEYNADLYERLTVRRLLEQFRGLLEGIAADPTRRISEFLLTSPGERNLPAPPADQAAGLTVLAHPPSEPARDDYVAPRDPVEARLAELWERALGAERISVTADFFDVGGHSLLAARLLAQVHKVFRRKLSLASLLQSPTIEDAGGPTSHAEIPAGARLPGRRGRPSGGRVGRPGRAGLSDAARRLPTALARRGRGAFSPPLGPQSGGRSTRLRRGVAGVVGPARRVHGEGRRRQAGRCLVRVGGGGPLPPRRVEPRRPDRV